MYNEPHDLHHEFPEYSERIHKLKTEDAHFRTLFDAYDKLDHQVRRAETEQEPMSDEALEELKRRRVQLKDDLYARLKAG